LVWGTLTEKREYSRLGCYHGALPTMRKMLRRRIVPEQGARTRVPGMNCPRPI